MFDIDFCSDPEASNFQAIAFVNIGDFREKFEVSLEFWSAKEYRAQWREGIKRVVNLGTDSCLIASVADPSQANFIFWWVIYVKGTEAIFQNQILFLEDVRNFNISAPWESIAPREILSEDGMPISEWRIPIVELFHWLVAPVPSVPSTVFTDESEPKEGE